MTYEEIRQNEAVNTYIRQADAALATLGFTEHSFAHVTLVAEKAGYILQTLAIRNALWNWPRLPVICMISAILSTRLIIAKAALLWRSVFLDHLKFDPEEIAIIVSAIGNHDEGTGVPVSPVAAALILADKSDVRRNRVHNTDSSTFDIHDRVNYSVTKAELKIMRPTPSSSSN